MDPIPTNAEQWRRLLRRAFEIPDLVGDDHADRAVALACFHGNPPPPRPPGAVTQESLMALPLAVVRTFIGWGVDGKLDPYLVQFDLSIADWDDAVPNSLASGLTNAVGDADARPLIDHLIKTAIGYARAYPWSEIV